MLLSTRTHLLDMALLKPTLPLGIRWGSKAAVSGTKGPPSSHHLPRPCPPGVYHELALGQAFRRDAAQHPRLMAALPGNLLALSS